MDKKKFMIHPVIDNAENYYIKHPIFDLPLRLLLIGKSQFSGKSNFIVNLLLKDEFYLNYFKGDNIYIISPSISNDEKLQVLVKVKDIPSENIFIDFDENVLEELYNNIQEDYEEAVSNKEIPEHQLIIFDDISFNNDLAKRKGIISKIFSNGRHILINTILTSQKYSSINNTARENATGVVMFSNMTDKQVELMETDHNRLGNKKQFIRMYRDITKDKYSFMVVNYTKDFNNMYLNKFFEPIDYNKYLIKKN